MRALLCLFVLAACGPKPAALPIPRLPGDGDANVAKPPPVAQTSVEDDPWAGKTDLIAAPQPKPPQKLELPHIDEFKLANGLDVFVVKMDRLPIVSMQLAVRAGRMAEPRARLGVSEATADMLVKGTAKHDAAAIAKAIDLVGGTISAESTYEASLLSCSVLVKAQGTCIELLPEMVTQPTFPDDELAKIKDQMVGNVLSRLEDAGGLAAAHVQNLLWGNDHVRGWINSEATVRALRRDDLVAWHRDWFVPNNAMLVVSGDVDAKKLKPELERAFGGWKKKPVPPAPTYKEPGLSGIRIRLVDKPGQPQTHIRIGQFGIKHDDPRFFDTLVWNHALGGGLGSRLSRVARDGGKVYGVASSFDRNFDRGSFVVSTVTRSTDAIAAVKLIAGEIAKMAKDGPTQEELDGAVANLGGGYGLRFQAAEDVGGALLSAELHGFGLEYLANYPLAIGKVDLGSAKQAAAEILDPRDYVLVLVGDAKDLEPQLQKEGWRYEKVAFTDPITPEVKDTTPVDAKAMAAAKQLVADALAAKGGKKVVAMKAFRLTAKGTAPVQGTPVALELVRTFVVPDKMRIDATLALPQGKLQITIAADGPNGWQQQTTPKGTQSGDLQKDDPQVAFERWREADLILLKATDPAAKLAPSADETIDGKPQAVVRLAAPIPGVDVMIYIDKKTKMITRMAYSDGHQTQSDDFSDYRNVGGIEIAYKRKQSTGGAVTDLELRKFEIDPKLDASTFAKPAIAPAPTK